MNDALKMQISAFVDDELPENETELLLRRLSQDRALRQQVAEYLAIGRLLRRDRELPGMNALRGRIALALGEETEAPLPGVSSGRSRLLKPVAGLAIAAAVAVLAVVGLRQSVLPEPPDALEPLAGDLIAPATAITEPAADEVLSDELRQMYLRHSAASADFGGNGIITRLVTLELSGGELVQVDPDARLGEGENEQDDEDTAPGQAD